MQALTKSNKQINKAIQDAEMKESKPGPKGDKGVTGMYNRHFKKRQDLMDSGAKGTVRLDKVRFETKSTTQ